MEESFEATRVPWHGSSHRLKGPVHIAQHPLADEVAVGAGITGVRPLKNNNTNITVTVDS